MGLYVQGLLLDGERKSMEPMASRLIDDPAELVAMRQRLQECISVSPWDERDVYRKLALKLEAEMPDVEALVIDDTGFPKKGKASVGVARQYSGTLGRTDNCQVATSLHLASEKGSGCIGFRLYLPESWTEDRERCRKAGVPDGERDDEMTSQPGKRTRARVEQPEQVRSQIVTLRELAERYVRVHVDARLKPSTADRYRQQLRDVICRTAPRRTTRRSVIETSAASAGRRSTRWSRG